MATPGPLAATLGHLQDTLKAAGVAAAIDPRDLNLPAIWITADTVVYNRLEGGTRATVEVQLFAVAGDTGAPLDDLDALIGSANEALATTDWEALSLLLVSQAPTPMPAMKTTITMEWSK